MSDVRDKIATMLDSHSLFWDNSAGDWRCYCQYENTSAVERHDEHVAEMLIRAGLARADV